jgi:hypothetical protein
MSRIEYIDRLIQTSKELLFTCYIDYNNFNGKQYDSKNFYPIAFIFTGYITRKNRVCSKIYIQINKILYDLYDKLESELCIFYANSNNASNTTNFDLSFYSSEEPIHTGCWDVISPGGIVISESESQNVFDNFSTYINICELDQMHPNKLLELSNQKINIFDLTNLISDIREKISCYDHSVQDYICRNIFNKK